MTLFQFKNNSTNITGFETNAISTTSEWEYTATDYVADSPVICDLQGDGLMEIIFTSQDGKVYCLNDSGLPYWVLSFGATCITSPNVVDINKDGKLEILVTISNMFYCINHTGDILWSLNTYVSISSSPSVADLDGDGCMEIFFCDFTGKIWCLTDTGGPHWSYQLFNYCLGGAAVADLDGDGYLEIIYGCIDENVYCLNYDGTLKWNHTVNSYISTSPAIGDLDNDGTQEVIICSEETNTLYCLNASGGKDWHFDIGPGMCQNSQSIGDIDNDGYLEVIVGSTSTTLYCLNYTGSIEWQYNHFVSVATDPILTDINNDDYLEVLVGFHDEHIYCLDHLGDEMFDIQIQGQTMTILTADLNGDNLTEIIYTKSYWDGDAMESIHKIHCLSLSGVTRSGPEQWYCFRGSPFCTGQIDSDGDYLDDLTEQYYSCDENDPDMDSDNLTDGEEIFLGTNPKNNDTDNDGHSDYEEVIAGTDPLDPTDPPAVETSTKEGFFIGSFLGILIVYSINISIIILIRRRKTRI
ncbi:MAG: FG-GAP-like repeat-containing protein [Candidatus Heimdallarchaeota archaeon]